MKIGKTVFVIMLMALGTEGAPNVCFSPEGHCDKPLLEFLTTAKHTVDVAIYDVNLPGVTRYLSGPPKGVKVRMVVDKKQAAGKSSTVPALIGSGVALKYGVQKGSGIMHNKFSIVDGKCVEFGSFNYTAHATGFNHENQYYTCDSAVVSEYAAEFERLWASGRKP